MATECAICLVSCRPYAESSSNTVESCRKIHRSGQHACACLVENSEPEFTIRPDTNQNSFPIVSSHHRCTVSHLRHSNSKGYQRKFVRGIGESRDHRETREFRREPAEPHLHRQLRKHQR